MRQIDWRLSDLIANWSGTAGEHLPLVIQTDRIAEGDVDVAHRHLDFVALMIVRTGRGLHRIDGVSYGIARGDVYVMAQGVTHLWSSFDDLVLDSFYFSPQIFAGDTLEILRETPGFLSLFVEEPMNRAYEQGRQGLRWLHLTPGQHARIETEILELRQEWVSGTRLGTLLTQGLLVRFLAHLALLYADPPNPAVSDAPSSRPSDEEARQAAVAGALRYMETNFTDPISVEDIAASVFLSSAQLRKVFSLVMGRSPHDYLHYLRLEHAKTLLTTTSQTITQIGQDSGLGESAYFARVFRRETGMTPKEYRKVFEVPPR